MLGAKKNQHTCLGGGQKKSLLLAAVWLELQSHSHEKSPLPLRLWVTSYLPMLLPVGWKRTWPLRVSSISISVSHWSCKTALVRTWSCNEVTRALPGCEIPPHGTTLRIKPWEFDIDTENMLCISKKPASKIFLILQWTLERNLKLSYVVHIITNYTAMKNSLLAT